MNNFTTQIQLTAAIDPLQAWNSTKQLLGTSVVFATQAEADTYGLFLLANFPGAFAAQTITTTDPVNAQFTNGKFVRLQPYLMVPFGGSAAAAPTAVLADAQGVASVTPVAVVAAAPQTVDTPS